MFQGQENRAGEEDYRSQRKIRAENTVPWSQRAVLRRKQQRKRKTTKEQPEINKVNMEKLCHTEQEELSQGRHFHHSQFY